ncbi:MAG: putative transposase [Colwellia sp.]
MVKLLSAILIKQLKLYSTSEEAKGEIFNFTEMFYNPKKRHSYTDSISATKFEKAYFSKLKTV